MKLIILLGFSKGLGKAIYQQLIIGLKPNERELLALGRNVNDFSHHECIQYQEVDLLKMDCWEGFKLDIHNNVKTVDVIINASVIEPIGAVGCLESNKIEDSIYVNYISPSKLVNSLIAQQDGTDFTLNLYNITSGASSRPIDGWALYCSTKAAFRMFLDVVQAESEGQVSVKHIDPGVVDTDMQRTIRSKSEEAMKDVQQFKELKNSNKLKSPEQAARDVLVYLELS